MKRQEIDFGQLDSYALKLEKLNDDYSKKIFDFKNKVSGIRENTFWSGDDTDQYMNTILTTYMDSFEKILELGRNYVSLLKFVSSSSKSLENDLKSRSLVEEDSSYERS